MWDSCSSQDDGGNDLPLEVLKERVDRLLDDHTHGDQGQPSCSHSVSTPPTTIDEAGNDMD
jgi:hypothetical protein